MHLRVLKYLSDNGVDLDQAADNRDKFVLTDNSDGKGIFISSWNVPDVTKPKEADLPTEASSNTWGKGKRNVGKIKMADFDGATSIAALKAQIKPGLQKLGMFEE